MLPEVFVRDSGSLTMLSHTRDSGCSVTMLSHTPMTHSLKILPPHLLFGVYLALLFQMSDFFACNPPLAWHVTIRPPRPLGNPQFCIHCFVLLPVMRTKRILNFAGVSCILSGGELYFSSPQKWRNFQVVVHLPSKVVEFFFIRGGVIFHQVVVQSVPLKVKSGGISGGKNPWQCRKSCCFQSCNQSTII